MAPSTVVSSPRSSGFAPSLPSRATSAADYQQLYDAARAQRAARDAEEQTGCSAARWDSAAVHRGGRATTTMTP